jgi:thymidylate synthase (FAD)
MMMVNDSKVELKAVLGSLNQICEIASICYDEKGCPNPEKLLEQKHLSPFEFMSFLFYIETPIFVARQILRHRNATYMEKSLRYTEAAQFYIDQYFETDAFIIMLSETEESYKKYSRLLELGVPKQDARCVLPVSTITKFYMKIDLRSLINFFEQRISKKAQKQTRQVALKMFELLPSEVRTLLLNYIQYFKEEKNGFN